MWDTISEYLDWRLLTIVALVAWLVMRSRLKRMATARYEEVDDETYDLHERIRDEMAERQRNRKGR